METQQHRFIVFDGEITVNGKSQWPDYLEIEMSRDAAFRMIESLLLQLRDENSAPGYRMFGKLETTLKF